MEDEVIKITGSYTIISYPSAKLPEQYFNMVLSKWLRSLRYGNDYFKLMDSKAYFEVYNEFIIALLNKPESIIKLAVLTDDHDVALGWSVHRGTILDYIHVHKDVRKQGIGTSLLPQGIKRITHLTNVGMAIWAAKYPEFIFNPFA